MSQGDGQGQERRIEPRYQGRYKVVFRTHEEQGSGTLHDISMSGARVDEASMQPKPGARLRLEFAPRADCLPVEVLAHVVRECGSGFAVEFSALDPRMKRLLRSIVERAEAPPTDRS